MGNVSRMRLYLSTIRHLKISQVKYRVLRRFGFPTPLRLGYYAKVDVADGDISRIPVLRGLDFDPVFLARFDSDALLRDEVELLRHMEKVDWSSSWNAQLSTPLWRFNLHYCEYLLPLANQYLTSGDARYFNKAKAIILSWIESCPEGTGGAGWHPYTISLRVINWLAFYAELSGDLKSDNVFVEHINGSILAQYKYLARHLEKDLLANHYFENLKTLVIVALYFDDRNTLNFALDALKDQVAEQILPDGIHFELSPMYHKIVMEGLLRTTAALKHNGVESSFFDAKLQSMASGLYSIERNANRTPLFNDSGDNVAKHKDALLACAQSELGIVPSYCEDFPDAGYYLLERTCAGHTVKIIFDAGKPGPKYAMGHVHCDCLSFECFVDGEPWIVNCGTYAYQDVRRKYFRGTAQHSAPMIDGCEQSECWSEHRVARRGEAYFTGRVMKKNAEQVSGELRDCRGGYVKRTVELSDSAIKVLDSSSELFDVFFHLRSPQGSKDVFSLPEESSVSSLSDYSTDFGVLDKARCLHCRANGGVVEMSTVPFGDLVLDSTGGMS